MFIIVVGTPGYATIGEAERTGGEPAKELYENGLDDDTRVLSARLPPAEKRRYTWDFQYDLVPSNRSLMAGLVGYWVTTVVIGLVTALLALLGVAGGLEGVAKTLSAGMITSTVGLIFALDAGWADRYRLLCVIPLLLHGMSWVLWTVPGTSVP